MSAGRPLDGGEPGGRPLRIALLCYRGNMRCGGQGVYLWHLARELCAQGHEVEVFAGPPAPDPMPFCAATHAVWSDEFWSKWFSRDRAVFVPRDRPWSLLSPLRFYELGASWIGFFEEPFVFSVRAFRRLAARRGDFDVVHDVQSLGWGLLGVRALGLPVVSTVHHPLSVDRRAALRRDRGLRHAVGTLEFHPVTMQAQVARRLDAILTSSGVGATLLERDFGVPRDRVRVVGNGLDLSAFAPDPAARRDPAALLCVARAGDPNKGVGTLIDALARLPAGVRLTLVDEDPSGNPALARARRMGVAERVRVTGALSRDALVAHYRSAAVVVVPSRFEGFGLPAVEALACGTPVVACGGGALREILEGVGPLVPPDRPEALAEAIARLLDDEAERERVATAGRARVLERFAWPEVGARTAEVYRDVLRERGRPERTSTSASEGTLRATRSRPTKGPRAARDESRVSTQRQARDCQPPHPHASETPRMASMSSQRPACSRRRPGS